MTVNHGAGENERPTTGSLFSGAGLLDIGLHLAGWEHRWFCESDPWRRDLLRRRFPGAVVFDDVRTLRGAAAADADSGAHGEDPERRTDLQSRTARCLGNAACVTLIAGGFPCKGASTAGKREGFEHAETVLWAEMRRIVGDLRPRYVLIENVANILGMAASPSEPPGSLWGTVLGDLAALGFDVVWDCVPAAAVGAPHLRDRVFCVAVADRPRHAEGGPGSATGTDGERTRPSFDGATAAVAYADEPRADSYPEAGRPRRATGKRALGVGVDWGDYEPAIRRWETTHGAAPQPLVRRLDDGDAKLSRLRARMDRSRLSALGDGVHVYVGWLAGEHIMSLERARPVVAA